MASSAANQISFSGLNIEYYNLALVAQTFFFGTYSVLIVLSTRMLLRRLKTRMDHVLFAYSVALGADRMRNYIKDVLSPVDFSDNHTPVTKWNPLFNSLVLVNYVCSDAVVVWRAWIIASASRNYRKYLYIACFFLVLTFFSVTGTIVFQIIGVIEFPLYRIPHNSYLTYGTNVLQTMNLVFSLISNLIATVIVAATAFRHRKMLRAAFAEDKKNTKSEKVLTLLAESGALYCISTVTTMVASLIRLPAGGTLGDLYTPVNIQIAGAYPPVVLLLGSMQNSLNETTFLDSTPLRSIPFAVQRSGSASQNHRSAVGTVHFAQNPNLSRTDRTELGLRTVGTMA
ncbi:hypothetical protein MVEN_00665100 [Mycena venus]|uniref:Uncharacterized protein n=1 Tax=Mycena venus TaxID=2733690 RepID=A0A8H6YRQ0_9AGAR|nr:hypothetical protein MVEN_00665100 [Mycena venus]